VTDDHQPATLDAGRPDARSAEDRTADHAAIERLAEDFLPALIAKLGASGLGEIEIGEEGWIVRVRRTGDSAAGHGRRLSDRAARSQPGHAGHGHAPGGFESHRTSRESKAPGSPGHAAANGSSPSLGFEAPGTAGQRSAESGPDVRRVVATSPAVGVFQPKVEITPGTRVRSGDRLGAVDMLGIPQEVVAPADGIVGGSLVESGQAVEYGQELIVLELTGRPTERREA